MNQQPANLPSNPLIPRLILMVAGTALAGASPFLLNFLSQEESSGVTRLVVYADHLAGGLPTVCDGLTKHVTSTPIIVGDRWTLEQCQRETAQAVYMVQKQLAPCFKRPPNQAVFDMATSHAWNLGVGATCSSEAMKAWNNGDWELGCRRLALSDAGKPVWSYTCKTVAAGKRECTFVQGLANRREREWSHCAAGAKEIEYN